MKHSLVVAILSLWIWVGPAWGLDFDAPQLKSVTEYPDLQWGAKVRMWVMIREGSNNGPEGLYLMQAEPKLTVDINEYLVTVFSFNLGGQPLGFGAQNAYGQVKLPESAAAATTFTDIQFGLMHIPFGLPVEDHTSSIRKAYGLEIYRTDLVVKVGREGAFYYDLGYTNGGRDVSFQMDGGWGGFVDAGVSSAAGDLGYKLGASVLAEVPNPNVSTTLQQMYAVYTDLSLGRFRLQGEFDWSTDKTVAVTTSATTSNASLGFFAELFFDILDNLNTSFRYDYFASNASVFGDGLRVLQLSFRYRLLTYLTLEPVFRLRTHTRSDQADPADNSAYLLATLMF